MQEFLYSGKLKIVRDTVTPIRTLIVDILRVDAKFKLPGAEDVDPKAHGDDNGGGGGSGNSNGHDPGWPPHSNGEGGGSADDQNEPPEKRFREGNGFYGADTTNHDSYTAPTKPPHELEDTVPDEDDDDILEVEVVPPPRKATPPLIDLSDGDDDIQIEDGPSMRSSADEPIFNSTPGDFSNSKATSDVRETKPMLSQTGEVLQTAATNGSMEEGAESSANAHDDDESNQAEIITPAPSVIAKSTSGRRPLHVIENAGTADVIPAPRIVAKSTGAPFREAIAQKRGRGRPPKGSSGRHPKSLGGVEVDDDGAPLQRNDSTLPPKKRGRPSKELSTGPSAANETLLNSIMSPSSASSDNRDILQEAIEFAGVEGGVFRFNLHGKMDDQPSRPGGPSTIPMPRSSDGDDSHSRFTRSRIVGSRPSYNELSDDDEQEGAENNSDIVSDDKEDDADYRPDFAQEERDARQDQEFELPPMPPPIPQDPNGLVIHRGRYVTAAKKARILESREQPRPPTIRKHNPCKFSITGRKLDVTDYNQLEPAGIHKCPHCDNVYEKLVSLRKHIGRAHNTGARYKCPECPKLLTAKNALGKHLLSHRPESQWPYYCELCGKRFQAKADLPKHYFSNKHAGDPRIPIPQSPAWFEMLRRSLILPAALHSAINKALQEAGPPILVPHQNQPLAPLQVPPQLYPVSQPFNIDDEQEEQKPEVDHEEHQQTNNEESPLESPRTPQPKPPSSIERERPSEDDASSVAKETSIESNGQLTPPFNDSDVEDEESPPTINNTKDKDDDDKNVSETEEDLPPSLDDVQRTNSSNLSPPSSSSDEVADSPPDAIMQTPDNNEAVSQGVITAVSAAKAASAVPTSSGGYSSSASSFSVSNLLRSPPTKDSHHGEESGEDEYPEIPDFD